MRSLSSLIFLLCLTGMCLAQERGTGQPRLTVHSTLVMVPVFVNTKEGDLVFGLNADDFLLTDNGLPQVLTLEQDTDSQPLALAIVVETGGAGAAHLSDYQELDSVLDALVGNVQHRVAVISFDGKPHLIVKNRGCFQCACNAFRGRPRCGRFRCGCIRCRATAGAAHEVSVHDFAAQRND
jgi:hypothetical protein